MRMFLYEYGRVLLTTVMAVLVLAAAGSGLMRKWRQFGGVNDSVKTNFLTDEEKRTPPVLTARDFKVHGGESVRVEQYVSAVDYDGTDISEQIQAELRKDSPGLWRYDLQVRSPVTGKTVRGSLIALVDCPQEGDGKPLCE